MGNAPSTGGSNLLTSLLRQWKYEVPSTQWRSTVACTTQNTEQSAAPRNHRSMPLIRQPTALKFRRSMRLIRQPSTAEYPRDLELLYEVDALELTIRKHLSKHLNRDYKTNAVWATIPRALDGRSSKVLLVDRHHMILASREYSVLYQELRHHVRLSTEFYKSVQRNPSFPALSEQAPRLQEIQHPHILRLYGFFMRNRTLHVLTEFCQHGNLYAVLEHDKVFEQRHGNRLIFFRGEEALKEMTRQLCSAVAFMHENQLAHTNLKPENVFVNNHGHIVVGDFKKAIFTGENSITMAVPAPTQCDFVAPERYEAVEVQPAPIDLVKADAWSVGALIFAITTRQCLFKSASTLDLVLQEFRTLDFEAYYEKWRTEDSRRDGDSVRIPDDIKILLSELLQVNPSVRCTVADATRRFDWLKPGGMLTQLDSSEWKL